MFLMRLFLFFKSVDMYENFFSEIVADHASEPPSVRTVCVLRDPNDTKRSATNLSWLPDGSGKLICSYSVMQFQKMPANMPMHSYVWDVNNPNEPEYALTPPSPACAFAFNPKSPDMLVGGLYNGLLAFWDVRKQGALELSNVETSHHDPVYDVQWVQSRTNQEFCSVSTDGFMMWWDARNMKAPLDVFSATLPDVEPVPAGQNDNASRYGIISLEYRTDAGATKYLVGTETGEVISLERKAKKEAGSIITVKGTYGTGGENSHHGPIYSIKRNPGNTKFFLTVGDWGSKIWFEDAKAPVVLNRYENTYLTSANWSTTRPGVFLATKLDGTLDVWDIFYRQDEPVLSTKIGDAGLTCVQVHGKGKLAAVGAVDGSISLLELSESLVQPQNNEKNLMTMMFERESKREKHNDQLRFKRNAAGGFSALAARNEALTRPAVKERDALDAESLRTIEKEFQQRLANPPAALGGIAEAAEGAEEEEAEQ
jgi:dynein intermediate chain 2